MTAPGPVDALRRAGFRGRLEAERPLGPLTTWRIGGPAECLATPADADDLARALAWATATGTPARILGNGSNLLVDDAGVRGIVLRLRKTLDATRVEGDRLTAGAGASFPAVARLAVAHGLAGLEFATGIPGTVGGAIRMNAGWHEFETGNLVERVRAVDRTGEPLELAPEACAFGYRTSRFAEDPAVVVEATFRLPPGDRREIRAKLDGFARSRKENQPTALPSCGSVFLKPPGDFAGRLIEAAGLKGLRVGGIEVSTLHANFFVNRGGGTARDALALVARVEREVRDRFGVELTREFESWADPA